MTIQIRNLDKEIREAKEEVSEQGNKEFRSKVLQAYGDLKLATPVDTGRARNSWNVSVRSHDFKDGDGNFSIPPNTNKIYISNGTPYIERLNNGHSKQAPKLFIDAVIKRYFPEVKGKVVDVVKR